jgi:hypothetical protein
MYASMDPSPGQRAFMRAIYSREPQYRQVVAKVHRKGGKTKSAAVTFASLFRLDPTLRIFHLSGSYLQASRLYDYFKPLVTNQELFPDALEDEPKKYKTTFKAGGSLEVLTASAKSIRGGDADILSIDEAVLVPQKLLDAAWPLVRASKHPKRIVTSTASPDISLEWFVRLWQNAKAMRFERFEWPQSECPWINQEETELAKLMLDSRTFAVEYGGAIAERTGQVWGSQLVDNALVNPNDQTQYPLPAEDPLTMKWTALDWGFVGQAVLTFWEKQGDTLYLRDCRIWTETSYTEIKQEIAADFGKYPIYPDSEAVADNKDLSNLGMAVYPVIFSKEKDQFISRVRWRLEKGLIKIPNPEQDQRYFTLVQQMKAYHYNEKTGKPVKINDHCCDSVICAMKPVETGFPFATLHDYTQYVDRRHHSKS